MRALPSPPPPRPPRPRPRGPQGLVQSWPIRTKEMQLKDSAEEGSGRGSIREKGASASRRTS